MHCYHFDFPYSSKDTRKNMIVVVSLNIFFHCNACLVIMGFSSGIISLRSSGYLHSVEKVKTDFGWDPKIYSTVSCLKADPSQNRECLSKTRRVFPTSTSHSMSLGKVTFTSSCNIDYVKLTLEGTDRQLYDIFKRKSR